MDTETTVTADEVRQLAERLRHATSEMRDLLWDAYSKDVHLHADPPLGSFAEWAEVHAGIKRSTTMNVLRDRRTHHALQQALTDAGGGDLPQLRQADYLAIPVTHDGTPDPSVVEKVISTITAASASGEPVTITQTREIIRSLTSPTGEEVSVVTDEEAAVLLQDPDPLYLDVLADVAAEWRRIAAEIPHRTDTPQIAALGDRVHQTLDGLAAAADAIAEAFVTDAVRPAPREPLHERTVAS